MHFQSHGEVKKKMNYKTNIFFTLLIQKAVFIAQIIIFEKIRQKNALIR